MSLSLWQKSDGKFGVTWGQNGVLSGSGIPLGNVSGITDSVGAQTVEKYQDPASGEFVGLLIAGQFQEGTIEVFPSSTTLTLGKAQNLLPAIGSECTITDAMSNDQTGGIKYRVMSATRNRRAGGMVSITMQIWRANADFVAVA